MNWDAVSAIAESIGVVGVIVHEVVPGSPAAGAGLRPLRTSMFGNVVSFDLLVALDGVPLLGYDDLFSVLEEHEPGDEVGLQYVRGDDEFAVRLLLQ